jgi:hypothetical protein
LLFAGLKPAGGKQFMRPYLEKTHHRKVAQGVQTPVNKTKLRFFYQFFFFLFLMGVGISPLQTGAVHLQSILL